MKLQYVLLLSALCSVSLAAVPLKRTRLDDKLTSLESKAEDLKKDATFLAAVANVNLPTCILGQHNYNKKCESNNDAQCKKFDKVTGNCAECKWYAWMVKNDATHANVQVVGVGNWCESRWWLWTIILVSSLLLLAMLVGVIVYCCSKGKKAEPEEKKPLNIKKEVEVQSHAPVYHRHVVQAQPHHHHSNTVYQSSPRVERRVVQGETRVVQGHSYTSGHQQHSHVERNVENHGSYVSGDRHASELRSYSPTHHHQAEPRVIKQTDTGDYHRSSHTNKYYNNN